jgi:hypothetical protein
MTDAVTLKAITGFSKISSGFDIATTGGQVKVRPGSEERKPLDYLMARNIYPFAVDYERSLVYFIETNAEIRNNQAPFFHIALYEDAKNLLEVRIDRFLALVASLNVPKEPELIYIHHPGRCGSTLLHKLLGSHPDIESLSEDLVVENFLVPGHGARSEELYRAIVQLTAFKLGAVSPRKLAFKCTGFSSRVFDRLRMVFPNAKHIYLTRDPIRIAESWINAWRGNWLYRTCLKLRLYNFRVVPYAKVRPASRFAAMADPYFEARAANRGTDRRYIRISEAWVLSVLIIDQFFKSRLGVPNLLYLRHENTLSREKVRQHLDPFLGFNFSDGMDEGQYNTHSQLGDLAKTPRFRYHKFNTREKEGLARFQQEMSQMVASFESAAVSA